MNEEDFCLYDLWDDNDGNIAYIRCNISPENMNHLENVFIQKYPIKKQEEGHIYLNRFFSWLREDDNVIVDVIERPSNSIELLRKLPVFE